MFKHASIIKTLTFHKNHQIFIKINNTKYFSTLKTKLQKYSSIPYTSINQFYKNLQKFQTELNYENTLKYQKLLEKFDKKIKNIVKKNKVEPQIQIKDNKQSQELLWRDTTVIQFNQPLNTTKTYQFFYRLATQSHRPNTETYQIKQMTLEQLMNTLNVEQYEEDLNYYYTNIANKIKSENGMYTAIKQRMQNLQHYFCMLVFEGYKQFYCSSIQTEKLTGNSALQNLYGTKPVYESDFKFIPKQISKDQLNKISKIGMILTKYNFISNKISLFAQLIFKQQKLNQQLTPQSLRNILYILAHCRSQVLDLQPKLYGIFDLLKNQYQNINSRQNKQQEQYWVFELLYYMLSGDIENYSLIQQICQLEIPSGHILSKIDQEILVIMQKLLHFKYNMKLSIQNSAYLQFPEQESECETDFMKHLKKYHYPYTVIESENNNLSNDMVVEIEKQKFICLKANRYLQNHSFGSNSPQKHGSSINGIGLLILQCFKAKNQTVNIINTGKIIQMDKLTKKQAYLKNKLKGVKPLKVPRVKKYDF